MQQARSPMGTWGTFPCSWSQLIGAPEMRPSSAEPQLIEMEQPWQLLRNIDIFRSIKIDSFLYIWSKFPWTCLFFLLNFSETQSKQSRVGPFEFSNFVFLGKRKTLKEATPPHRRKAPGVIWPIFSTAYGSEPLQWTSLNGLIYTQGQ